MKATWMQRIERAQIIMSAAWRILNEDKTLLLLPIASSATIFDVVLYRYATGGTITPGFDRELLEASFVSKSI